MKDYLTSPAFIITVVMVILFLVSHIAYTILKKKNRENPEFIREQQEREEAYRKQIAAENERLAKEFMAHSNEQEPEIKGTDE